MTLNTNLRILVVDDSPTMRRIIVNALKELKFHKIDEADDGDTAWSKIKFTQYDLIICDWKMERVQGIEVLDPKYADVLFIMLTAEAHQENVMEAIKKGVDNYIVKPFDSAMLCKKITQTCSRRPQNLDSC